MGSAFGNSLSPVILKGISATRTACNIKSQLWCQLGGETCFSQVILLWTYFAMEILIQNEHSHRQKWNISLQKLVAFPTKAQVHSSVKHTNCLLTRIKAFLLENCFPFLHAFCIWSYCVDQGHEAVSLCMQL